MKTKFDSLLDFKDIHKGKRSFLIASGPSLDNFDLNKIKDDDIVFVVNEAVTAIKKFNYFCIVDGGVIKSNYFMFGVNNCQKVCFLTSGFFRNDIRHIIQKIDDEKIIVLNRRYKNVSNKDFNSKDGLLVVGGTVVLATANLAHVMGCSPICLVGVDLNYSNNKKYCDPSEFGKKISYDKSVPKPKVYKSGLNDPGFQKSYNEWKNVKKQNPNISFINLSKSSRLVNLFGFNEL